MTFMIDKIDLDELEQLARAASCGPWVFFEPREGAPFVEVGQLCTNGSVYGGAVWQAFDEPVAADLVDAVELARTGPYLEAVSPSVVLALIAEIRRLRGEISK